MTVGGRSRAAVAVLALVLGLGAAGHSWACVPQPLVTVLPRASGPVGAQVTVQGLHFAAGAVEARWNTLDGPLLATATGPQVAMAVTVPQAEAGLYSLLVFERRPDGGVGSSGRAAFEVVAGAPERAPGAAGSSRRPTTGTAGGAGGRGGVPVGAAVLGGVVLLLAGGIAGRRSGRRATAS